MFSLRNRFGIPGVISVIALVFAMLGGAYAASNSGGGKATASKTGKRGPRGPRGAAGPAGPVGPEGPAGANGKDGAAGANGTTGAPGKDGTSVTNTEVLAGNPAKCEERGGAEFKVGAGTPTYACTGEEGAQGPKGDPWTAGGTLPPGATETGAWTLGTVTQTPPAFLEGIYIPISFSIPLAEALDGSGCKLNETETEIVGPCHVHFINAAKEEVLFNEGANKTIPPANCPGNVAEPEADSGHLCVYARTQFHVKFFTEMIAPLSQTGFPGTGAGASSSGAILSAIGFYMEENAYGWGSWAVTG